MSTIPVLVCPGCLMEINFTPEFVMCPDCCQGMEKKERIVGVTPDCSYCGLVGGVGQFDSICEEHNHKAASGRVINGKFFPI